ncbi:hypothetical protein [Kosakonia arachidis]|nr:hypothetical protein [Kosakonia arachidis]
MFGLILSRSFAASFKLPQGLAVQASSSIGKAFRLAQVKQR